MKLAGTTYEITLIWYGKSRGYCFTGRVKGSRNPGTMLKAQWNIPYSQVGNAEPCITAGTPLCHAPVSACMLWYRMKVWWFAASAPPRAAKSIQHAKWLRSPFVVRHSPFQEASGSFSSVTCFILSIQLSSRLLLRLFYIQFKRSSFNFLFYCGLHYTTPRDNYIITLTL